MSRHQASHANANTRAPTKTATAAATVANTASASVSGHFWCSPLSFLLLFLGLCSGLAQAQECTADGGEGCKPTAPPAISKAPTAIESPGLEDAKAIFKEAIVTPAAAESAVLQVFPRSAMLSAVLLLGPIGMGKAALVDATAREIGAEVHLRLQAGPDVLNSCSKLVSSSATAGAALIVHVEALERYPSLALDVPFCLRAAAAAAGGPRLFLVATATRSQSFFSSSELSAFGYVATTALPQEPQRKEYLLRLLQQISRLDARWGAALREAEVLTLATLMSNFTYAEMELVVRRAFLRSVTPDGQDVVALHHFEKILSEFSAEAAKAFDEPRLVVGTPASDSEASSTPAAAPASAGGAAGKKKEEKKKNKGSKDPMEGIFGWCNFWLPEPLHLPPVVWAMILFGILAHFMARSMYQPYGQRKRRNGGPGGPGNPRGNSLFGDLGAGGLGAGMGPGLGAGLGAGMGGMGAGLGAGASQFPGLNSDNLTDWPFPASMGRGPRDGGLFPDGGPTSTPSPPATSSTARPDSSSQ
eukprot:CAMPEP_0206432344 /NCGR_PEP_ID=MMETSP0324_2-20121206/7869_1 /ASSEMBLY_ACC=CAM_ASM_000836 /TAXON_ID=2866 /ORGANISM="Crypthecodinium cohnii, Strain Seligo" /LENGTH=529 /DNA_ID=CAMNT_0053898375 /DNA_START=217 /DNA_END=1806 /DNA_ORIENTATION=-